jgi:hypothetical protein
MADAFHCVECGDGQHCTGGNGCVAEATRQVFGFRTPAPLPLYPTEAHIARALALLNRVGDAAAEAMIKGEAAVVPVEPTIEMVRASNPMDDAQDLLAHFTLHEGIAAGRLDREGA